MMKYPPNSCMSSRALANCSSSMPAKLQKLDLTITGMSSLAILLMMAFIQCFVGMTHVRSYLLLVVPVMLVGTVTVLYFEVGGETSMDSQVSCAISPYPNPLRPELNLIIKVAATAASVTVGITFPTR